MWLLLFPLGSTLRWEADALKKTIASSAQTMWLLLFPLGSTLRWEADALKKTIARLQVYATMLRACFGDSDPRAEAAQTFATEQQR